MSDFQNSPILEFSRSAERCVIGYEALYRQTRLSFAAHSRYTGPLDEHSSDADDEFTDLSNEYLNSPTELFITPKNYFTCNGGNKPLSLILRRCDTPTLDTQPRQVTIVDCQVTSFLNEVKNGSSNDCALVSSRDADENCTDNRILHEGVDMLQLPTSVERSKNLGQNTTPSQKHVGAVSRQENIQSKLSAAARKSPDCSEQKPCSSQLSQSSTVSCKSENILVCGFSDSNTCRDNDQYKHQFQGTVENALDDYEEEAGVSNFLLSPDTNFVSDKINSKNTVIDERFHEDYESDESESEFSENLSCAVGGIVEYDNVEKSKTRSLLVQTKNIIDHIQLSGSVTSRLTNEMVVSKQDGCFKKQNFDDFEMGGSLNGRINGVILQSNHETDCSGNRPQITTDNFKLSINEDDILNTGVSSKEVDKFSSDDSEYEGDHELPFSAEMKSPCDEANYVNCKVKQAMTTSFSEKNVTKCGMENNSQKSIQHFFSNVNVPERLSRNGVLPLEENMNRYEVNESVPVEDEMLCGKSKKILSNGMDDDTLPSFSLNHRKFTHLVTPLSTEFTQTTEVSFESRKSTDVHTRNHSQSESEVSEIDNSKEMSLDNDVLSEAKNISALNNIEETMSPVLTVPADHFASFEEIYDSLCQDKVSENVATKLVSDNQCDTAFEFNIIDMNRTDVAIAAEIPKEAQKPDVTTQENDNILTLNPADEVKMENTAFQKHEYGARLPTMITGDSLDFSSNFFDVENSERKEIANVATFGNETRTSPNPANLEKIEGTVFQAFDSEMKMSATLANTEADFTISLFDDIENSKETENGNVPLLESETKVPSSPGYLGEIEETVLQTYNSETKMSTTLDCHKKYDTKIQTSKCESRPSMNNVDDSLSYNQGKEINSVKDSMPVNSASDISYNRYCEKSNVSHEDFTTQSSFSLSPKNPILTTGMDDSQNPAEIINDEYMPVNLETSSNIMEGDSAIFIETQSSSCLINDLTASRASFMNADDASNEFSKQKETHENSFIAQTFTEDAMDCPYNEVPSDAAYLHHSPLLFSSDEENSCYTGTRSNDQKIVEEIKIPDAYDNVLTKEEEKLHRLQESLMGVPPPPSVTIPQISVSEMLKFWRENEKLMVSTNERNEIGTEETKTCKIPLATSSVDQAKNTSWPESKSCCYYGIQYNHGRASEEFESLSQKLRERYVGCETTSSCTIWFTDDVSNKINRMTNKRKNTGHSPGRRLSHLARRRQTFSSANLLNNVVGKLPSSQISTASEKRLIMVDIKKNERKQRSKGTRPQKHVPFVDNNRLQQTKRALFKSPPSGHKRVSSASKSRSGSRKDRSIVDQQRILSSRRALWPSTSNDSATSRVGHDRALTNISAHINVYGKRKREDDSSELKNSKCSRRLFDDATVKEKTDFTHTDVRASEKSQIARNGENDVQVSSHTRSSQKKMSGLAEHHRKKLLWAVAEALRAEGIGMSHEIFRPCASMLGCLVRSLLPDLNSKRHGRTTDLMLKLSKKHVKDVIKKQICRK